MRVKAIRDFNQPGTQRDLKLGSNHKWGCSFFDSASTYGFSSIMDLILDSGYVAPEPTNDPDAFEVAPAEVPAEDPDAKLNDDFDFVDERETDLDLTDIKIDELVLDGDEVEAPSDFIEKEEAKKPLITLPVVKDNKRIAEWYKKTMEKVDAEKIREEREKREKKVRAVKRQRKAKKQIKKWW
jgi:hypothetical protein